MGNGRESANWALAAHTPSKCDWGTFETSRNAELCEFRQTMPRFSGFPHKKTPDNSRSVLGRSKDSHLPLLLGICPQKSPKSRKVADFTGNTGNRKDGRKVADHIPVDFVMFYTKKCLVHYTYTYSEFLE